MINNVTSVIQVQKELERIYDVDYLCVSIKTNLYIIMHPVSKRTKK